MSADEPNIFTQTGSNTVLLFLAVYFIIILFLAVFFRDKLASLQIFTGRVLDIVVFGVAVYYAFFAYYNAPEADRSDPLPYIQTKIRDNLNDPNTMILVGLGIVVLSGLSYGFKMITLSESAPISITTVSGLLWIYMIVLGFFNFAKYFLHMNLAELLPDVVPPEETDTKGTADGGSEVFNVDNNLYSYENAREVCSSFGARLATYDEVENAYNKGAEWCNYGWSEGQMAFFPTQKDTWSVLQQNKENANACGRPGVNGGFINNPKVRFGANCYGKKPAPKENDLARMAAGKISPVPTTSSERQTQERVKLWDTAVVNAYNTKKWSSE